MKTLICGRGAETGGRSVQVHVLQTFRELGHEVKGFDPLLHGDTSEQRVSVLESLLGYWSPELLIHVPTGDDLDWLALQQLATNHEAMTIAISSGLSFGDAPVANSRLGELIATHDVVTTHDPSQKDVYKGAGSYALFEQLAACNVHALDTAAASVKPRASQILVLGDADAANAHIVRDLVHADLDVQIVGEGWADHADLRLIASNCVSLEVRVSRMLGAQLVLELPPTLAVCSAVEMSSEETGLNSSALEAVALGVPVMTARRAGVDAHLVSGIQVFTWEQPADITQLACMLLSDTDQLNDVALDGQVQLRANHQSLGRWISLFDEFSVTPAPLAHRVESVDDLRVAVVVPVDANTNESELNATIESIRAQTSSASEVLVVSSAERAEGFGNQVKLIIVPGADAATLVDIAVAESSSGLLAVAQPGETWAPDRLGRQVEHLHKNRDLDLSHGLLSDVTEAGGYHSWSLRRTLLDGQTLCPSAVLVRRAALARLGSSRLLLGDFDLLVAATTQLRCGLLSEFIVNAPAPQAPVEQVLAQSITSIFPEIERCENRQLAAAAAFSDLGARVAITHPHLSAELCGIALDYLEEIDSTLLAVHVGATPPTTELLIATAARLSDELATVVPSESDRVTTSDGRLLGNPTKTSILQNS